MNFDLPVNAGVIVVSVATGSPTEQAGLRQGEILVEAQDVPVDNVSELDAILIRYRAGAEVNLTGPLRAR